MIQDNLKQVHAQRIAACALAGRNKESVTLLVVSKKQSAAAITEAIEAGEQHFGENYVQEGLEKIASLQAYRAQLQWHLIGHLQSNKARKVAENFDWVHSIDSQDIARRLSDHRPPGLAPLQVCLQVNISQEATKEGVAPHEVLDLALTVAYLPRLRLRGLMVIPAVSESQSLAMQRQAFAHTAQLLQELKRHQLNVDTLSMGMSLDMQAAILEGATIVRVGTAIFGVRK